MRSKEPALLCRQQVHLAASPAQVFAALSEGEQLMRWFAEQSRPMPRPWGSYAFWGKHSFWANHIKRSRQYLSRFELPLRLSFRWQLDEHRDSEVDYRLAAEGVATRLELRHTLLEGAVDEQLRDLAGDFWRIALSNLLWYLETGDAMLRLDYREAKGDVDLALSVAAEPARVFTALTRPEEMNAWLSREAEVEPRPGGLYSFGWTVQQEGQALAAGPLRITEFVSDQLLAYTWRWPGEGPETEVLWRLEADGDAARVRLEHLGFAADRDSVDYKQGWAAFLCSLKLHLERDIHWD